MGQTYQIKWTSTDNTKNTNIGIYQVGPNGEQWGGSQITEVGAGINYYNWTIPVSGTEYNWKIVASQTINGNSISDESDNYFSIISATTSKASPCPPYGDLNNDGYITNADITAVENCMLGLSCTTEQLRRADVNNDGSVDMGDVIKIERYIEGLDTTFDVCGTGLNNIQNQLADISKAISGLLETIKNLINR
jgi:hypothetical protein